MIWIEFCIVDRVWLFCFLEAIFRAQWLLLRIRLSLILDYTVDCLLKTINEIANICVFVKFNYIVSWTSHSAFGNKLRKQVKRLFEENAIRNSSHQAVQVLFVCFMVIPVHEQKALLGFAIILFVVIFSFILEHVLYPIEVFT